MSSLGETWGENKPGGHFRTQNFKLGYGDMGRRHRRLVCRSRCSRIKEFEFQEAGETTNGFELDLVEHNQSYRDRSSHIDVRDE